MLDEDWLDTIEQRLSDAPPDETPFDAAERVLREFAAGLPPRQPPESRRRATESPRFAFDGGHALRLRAIRHGLGLEAIRCRGPFGCMHGGWPDTDPRLNGLSRAIRSLEGTNREALRDDFVQAFQACGCASQQRNLLWLAGDVGTDALAEACAQDLARRPLLVRARFLIYLANLGRTDFLPTAWDLLTPEPTHLRLRGLMTIARLDPRAFARALRQIESPKPPRILVSDGEPFLIKAYRRLMSIDHPNAVVDGETDAQRVIARSRSPDFEVLSVFERQAGAAGSEVIHALPCAGRRYTPVLWQAIGPVRGTNSPNLLVDFTVERPWRREAFVDANLLMWPPIGASEHLAPKTTAWGHLA